MKWEKPAFVEIGMNAEIGGYQSDFGDSEPAGPRKPVVGLTGVAPGASELAESRASNPL
jgi:hypothetical protein